MITLRFPRGWTVLILALLFSLPLASRADLAVAFNSASDVPVTSAGYSANGRTFNATLNFAPVPGTTLTVVKNTALPFISGTFSNLAQWQVVILSHGGVKYPFVANYHGGTGNDLVLQWAKGRPAAWGDNTFGELGNGSKKPSPGSVDVLTDGVLRDKTVVALAAGGKHSVALCSDGTLAQWGSDSIYERGVPQAVDTSGVLAGKTVVAISAGDSHSLALCSDGTVAAWGVSHVGQLGYGSREVRRAPVLVDRSGVLAGKTVVAISAGGDHSAAVCSDGTLVTWGANSLGQLGNGTTSESLVPVAVPGYGPSWGRIAIGVAAGEWHTLALSSDGTVAQWGGWYDASFITTPTQVAMSFGTKVVAISAGGYHSLALRDDGRIASWGNNSFGQLGNNSTVSSKQPVLVQSSVLSGKTIVSVSAGDHHSIARCSDGTVAGWGASSFGVWGNQSNPLPILVPSNFSEDGERCMSIVSGASASHNVGLIASPVPGSPFVKALPVTGISKTGATLTGTLKRYGAPATAFFEYGLDPSYGSTAAVALSAEAGFEEEEVSANVEGLTPGAVYHYRLTVVTATHTVHTADGVFAASADVTAAFGSVSDVPVTTAAFTATGAVVNLSLTFAPPTGAELMVVRNTGLPWIEGRFSNLAHGQVIVLAYGGINYRYVADYYGGSGNDLVLHWAWTRPAAWGANAFTQAAGENNEDRLLPGHILNLGALAGKTVIRFAAGSRHSLALCSDGTVASWGDNTEGQLGTGDFSHGFLPRLVSTSGVLEGKTVIAIAAGVRHSLALCSDGTVVAWGFNFSGQLGDNTGETSNVPVAVNTEGALRNKMVVAVSAGSFYSQALCNDGTLAVWGSASLSGSSRVPVAFEAKGALAGKQVVALTSGTYERLALCSDGTLVVWGAENPTPRLVDSGVLSGKSVVSAASGENHHLALCSDGTLASWGQNGSGQLGIGNTTAAAEPVSVTTSGALAGKTVISVAAGLAHSLVRCEDGTVLSWGENKFGQLGRNSRVRSTVPVVVNRSLLGEGEVPGTAFSGSSADHCLAVAHVPLYPVVGSPADREREKTSVTLTGTVETKGSETSAWLEYGTTTEYGSTVEVALAPGDALEPRQVVASIQGLAPGTTYHYRLTAENALKRVSTEDRTFTTSQDIVVTYEGASVVPVSQNDFSARSATFGATLNFAPPTGTSLTVVENTGTEFIHGTFTNLAHGQLVILPFGGINYRFIANYYGGSGNDLVLQWAATRSVGWGSSRSGELGKEPSKNDKQFPTEIEAAGALAGRVILAHATGSNFSVALCSDGTLASCGTNYAGQLGDGTTTASTVPVAVDRSGALSGKTVVAISAGSAHVLALCSDGTVVAWGQGAFGKLGNGDWVNSPVPVVVHASGVLAGKRVISIAAGGDHSLALCSDGTIAVWGKNTLENTSSLHSNVPVLSEATEYLADKSIVSIAAGGGESVALCQDGTLVRFAYTSGDSYLTVVSSTGALVGKTVSAVAAGGSHRLALCTDGTIVAWGSNQMGQLGNDSTILTTTPVAVDATGVLAGRVVTQVAAGSLHSIAVCSDGTIAAWGGNQYGQLGGESVSHSVIPVRVSGSELKEGERYLQVISGLGANHNLASVALPPYPIVTSLAPIVRQAGATLRGTVDPNGSSATAYFEYGLDASYGNRVDVVLADPDGTGAQNVSADISGLLPGAVYHYRLTAVNAISAPSTMDGTFGTPSNVVATYNGANDVPLTSPYVFLEGGTFLVSLNFAPEVGTNLMLVNNTGTGFINGKLADLAHGQLVTLRYGGVDYRFVANYYGGTGNDLVLQWAGTRLVSWGSNYGGQLGDGSRINRYSPVEVLETGPTHAKSIIDVAVGGVHVLALHADGTLSGWGANWDGELANGNGANYLSPIPLESVGALNGKVVVAVAAGHSYSLALCADGTVVAWGLNRSGQLGDGTISSRWEPAAVKMEGALAGKTVVAISAGRVHNLALCSDGTIVAWGDNSTGQLGDNTRTRRLVPVAVDRTGILAGKRVIAIAAGNAHSMALCSDGTVAAWGDRTYGQLGDMPILTGQVPVDVTASAVFAGKTVVAIAAGANHNLALCSDSTMIAWGQSSDGQLGNTSAARYGPVEVSKEGVLAGKVVTSIAAGGNHNIAQCSDGTLIAWGRNTTGQLGNDDPVLQSIVPVVVSAGSLAMGERFATPFSGDSSSYNVGLVLTPLAPAVITDRATNVVSGSVTLTGSVNAMGGEAAVVFDFGLDESYGTTVSGNPVAVSGDSPTNVSAIVRNLPPDTTFHYRVRAKSTGGRATGEDRAFTTPADSSGPFNGTMTVSPSFLIEAGSPFSVSFSGWSDWSMPLSYAVWIGDEILSEKDDSPLREIPVPTTAGVHVLKGRIYDGLGNFTEVTQEIKVLRTVEDWREHHFGTSENVGDAADLVDPDGDGLSNHLEYVAGLDPMDRESRFDVTVDTVSDEAGRPRVKFGPLVQGRTYRVQYREDLGEGGWGPLADFVASDNGRERIITDQAVPKRARFYRVEISRP